MATQAYLQEQHPLCCFNCAVCVTITACERFFQHKKIGDTIYMKDFNVFLAKYNSPLAVVMKSPIEFRWYRVHSPYMRQEGFAIANTALEEILVNALPQLVPYNKTVRGLLWSVAPTLMHRHYRRHLCWCKMGLQESCPHRINEQDSPALEFVNL